MLHVVLYVGETSSPYNEHCLPAIHKRDQAICTYFPSQIAVPNAITLFEGDGSPAGFLRALYRAIGTCPWDIIHVHAPQAGLVLLMTHLWASPQLRASTVYTVHNSFQNYKFRNKVFMLPVFASFRRVVCCSHVARDSFPPLFQRLAGTRLCAVQNGVDVERVDRILATTRKRADHGAFSVVSVAQLIERKDPSCVLQAFAASDDGKSTLAFAGVGDLHERLTEQVAQHKLCHRVELTGRIPREKVYERLSCTDLFVSASRGEGLPVAVLEAMACGCPVVLSDIPPHREIAAGTDFIPLIPVGDARGFAEELKRFRAMSPDERRMIGEKCRDIAVSRFSLRAMHAGYDAVYDDVINAQQSLRNGSQAGEAVEREA